MKLMVALAFAALAAVLTGCGPPAEAELGPMIPKEQRFTGDLMTTSQIQDYCLKTIQSAAAGELSKLTGPQLSKMTCMATLMTVTLIGRHEDSGICQSADIVLGNQFSATLPNRKVTEVVGRC